MNTNEQQIKETKYNKKYDSSKFESRKIKTLKLQQEESIQYTSRPQTQHMWTNSLGSIGNNVFLKNKEVTLEWAKTGNEKVKNWLCFK